MTPHSPTNGHCHKLADVRTSFLRRRTSMSEESTSGDDPEQPVRTQRGHQSSSSRGLWSAEEVWHSPVASICSKPLHDLRCMITAKAKECVGLPCSTTATQGPQPLISCQPPSPTPTSDIHPLLADDLPAG